MPTYRVTGPDGATYRVTAPEGATQEQVLEYAKAQASGVTRKPPQPEIPQASAKNQEPARAPTGLGNTVVMAMNMLATPLRELPGFRRGAEDLLDAGAQSLVNALPERFVAGVNRALGSQIAPTAAQFNRQQAEEERAYQAQRLGQGVDVGRLVGNIAGVAPFAPLLPGPGATLMGTAVKSAITGGATGALQPVTDDSQPFWEQKAEQAALGAVSGAVAGPAIQAASRVISPRVNDAVKYLMDRGVTPRPGQIIGPKMAVAEDKAMSLPIVGDKIAEAQRRAVEQFNRAAYNEVLRPLRQKYSGPVGRDGVAAVQDTLGKAYDDVLPKLQWKADRAFADEVKKIGAMAKILPPDKATQFKRVMENELLPRIAGGTMDGLSFKQMESELGRIARAYGSSASADDRMLANGINEILSSARSALERSNPKIAPQLRRINQAYATFTRVQDAAGRVGTEEGIFTPNQLLSAVRNMDKSARKGAFARGDALLQRLAENAKSVIGVKYPDSGTAGRLLELGAAAGAISNPALVLGGGVVGSRPYTQIGQNAIAKALTQRPQWSRPVGEALNRVSVPGGGVVGPLGAGLLLAPDEEGNQDYRYRR